MTGVHTPDSGSRIHQGPPVRLGRPLDAQAAGTSTVYQEINLVPSMSVACKTLASKTPHPPAHAATGVPRAGGPLNSTLPKATDDPARQRPRLSTAPGPVHSSPPPPCQGHR